MRIFSSLLLLLLLGASAQAVVTTYDLTAINPSPANTNLPKFTARVAAEDSIIIKMGSIARTLQFMDPTGDWKTRSTSASANETTIRVNTPVRKKFPAGSTTTIYVQAITADSDVQVEVLE